MRYPLLKQGVYHASEYLAEITQISNIDMSREGLVSWHGYQPGIAKNIYYPLEYQQLIDRHQYSLLLDDGSFFQFYFKFNNNALCAARLAYYPKPLATRSSQDDLYASAEAALDQADDQLYEHLYNWVELMEVSTYLPANTSHIRFDYDQSVETHSKSHLQLGAIQEFRIPADFVPLPLAFVEFCRGLYSNSGLFNDAHLGFAKNNCFMIPRESQIITLSSINL